MIEIIGEYNKAFLTIDSAEEAVYKQTYEVLRCPAFSEGRIVLMPDCHPGKGAIVGFTMPITKSVVPNCVGSDIGCGVKTVKLPNSIINLNFSELDAFIRKNIPYGRAHNIEIKKDWLHCSLYKDNIDKIIDVAIKTNQNFNDVNRQLCSLGSGNHYHEIDKDENNNFWLTTHTGSRNFGLKIATLYQNKAKQNMKETFGAKAYRDLEFLSDDISVKEYLNDMAVAQIFAKINRNLILRVICEKYFKIDLDELESIESVHNYIDFNDNILRKGAISAHKEERIIIPFNMADGAAIATGLGNPEWNFSAPHGAGRIGSRTAAKATLSMETYKKSMEGIWTSCISTATIDESKAAYKAKEFIVEAISPTAKIEKFIKPVYNFKAGEE